MLDAIRKAFKEGRHAEAIAQCEALCLQRPQDRTVKRLCATMHGMTGNVARSLQLLHEVRDPAAEDADNLFNIATCERQLGNVAAADEFFGRYARLCPQRADGWAAWAECRLQLGDAAAAVAHADRAIALDASFLPAWTVRGHGQRLLGRADDAMRSYERANRIQPTGEALHGVGLLQSAAGRHADAVATLTRAIALAPGVASLLEARGDARHASGDSQEAAADWRAALRAAPGDTELLKKATLALLELGRGEEALDACNEVLRAQPDNIAAKLGAEWLRSQLVPLWHVPMMNEPERNRAYHDGLQAVVTPGSDVFEIGTGSGLLAMMAARLGARSVHTCEAVGVVARTARTIVAANGLADRVTVVAKPSQAVQVGSDLPQRAGVIVHEIFSSELLGEHVLPAIEDARARLLAPGGVFVPGAAAIVVALAGGADFALNVHAGESFGFDLSAFNAIAPRKRPLYREDLVPELLSAPVVAFRFDFNRDAVFAPERRRIEIAATAAGTCYGLVQWIRLDMAEGVRFENAPAPTPRAVGNWQRTVYAFGEPCELRTGDVVVIDAAHDRARPWFDCVLVRRG